MENKLIFDEVTHIYTLDGKKLISVTQLMQKHGLAPSYAGVSTEVLEKKAERGTLIHQEIEEYNKTGEIGFTPEMEQFKNYIESNEIRVIESESRVNNDIVAGTIDLVLRQDEQDIIADIKTTYSLHKEAVSWQLSIYLWLYLDYDQRYPDINWDNYKAQAFHFNKEGELKVVNIPLKPYQEVEKLMECERKGELYKQEISIQEAHLLSELAEAEIIIQRIEEKKKQAENDAKYYREQLLKAMEERSIKSFENDKIKITYVAPSTRVTLDSKGVKEKYPDIYEEFSKTSETKASLRITLKESKNE